MSKKRKLEETSISPFVEMEIIKNISVLPYAMEDLHGHIRARLNKLILRYSSEISGVILSIADINFPPGKNYGSITEELPHIHFVVHARVLVFRPTIGTILTGCVNTVSKSHIGLLVFGVFNASISAESLGADFYFDEENRSWNDGTHQIVQGVYVEFIVQRIYQAAGLLSIDGSFGHATKHELVPDNLIDPTSERKKFKVKTK